MDRRAFLRDASFAGLALGGALRSGGSLLAQTAINHPGRIDVHHHYRLPGMDTRTWSAEVALHEMDLHNVAATIISRTSFPEELNDRTPEARAHARRANEFAARVGQDHPGRFGFFTALPLADTDGSLREIEYAFDTLGADGVLLGPRFLASEESPLHANFKQAIVDSDGHDTVLTEIPDIAQAIVWPGHVACQTQPLHPSVGGTGARIAPPSGGGAGQIT